MQSADRGLKDVLTRTFPDARTLEAHRRRGYDLLVRLIERAKDDGSLERDVVPEDVVLLLMANAGVVQGTGAAAPEAWRRFVGLMLDGLRSDGATDDPASTEPPPDDASDATPSLGQPNQRGATDDARHVLDQPEPGCRSRGRVPARRLQYRPRRDPPAAPSRARRARRDGRPARRPGGGRRAATGAPARRHPGSDGRLRVPPGSVQVLRRLRIRRASSTSARSARRTR